MTVPMLWLLRPLPATGWRGEAQKLGIGRAGVIRAGLPALFPRTPRHMKRHQAPGRARLCHSVLSAGEDHAAGCRLGQAEAELTASLPARNRGPARIVEADRAITSSPSPRGIARSETVASPLDRGFFCLAADAPPRDAPAVFWHNVRTPPFSTVARGRGTFFLYRRRPCIVSNDDRALTAERQDRSH
jgi:hypothetical protein